MPPRSPPQVRTADGAGHEALPAAEQQHRQATETSRASSTTEDGRGRQPLEQHLGANQHEHLQPDQQEQHGVQDLVHQLPEAEKVALGEVAQRIASLAALPMISPATTMAMGPLVPRLAASA